MKIKVDVLPINTGERNVSRLCVDDLVIVDNRVASVSDVELCPHNSNLCKVELIFVDSQGGYDKTMIVPRDYKFNCFSIATNVLRS